MSIRDIIKSSIFLFLVISGLLLSTIPILSRKLLTHTRLQGVSPEIDLHYLLLERSIRIHNDVDKSKYPFIKGSGTKNDPYIIENILLDMTRFDEHEGISIKDTNKYIVIRNCKLLSKQDNKPYTFSFYYIPIYSIGIHIYNSSNIIIRNVTFESLSMGIWLERSSEIYIEKNLLSTDIGLIIRDSKEIIIASNRINTKKIPILLHQYLNKHDYSTLNFINNTVNSRPVEVIKDTTDLILANRIIGHLILINTRNITIINIKIINGFLQIISSQQCYFNEISIIGYLGIISYYSNNCTFNKIIVRKGFLSIKLSSCRYFHFEHSDFDNQYGLIIDGSSVEDYIHFFENDVLFSGLPVKIIVNQNNSIIRNMKLNYLIYILYLSSSKITYKLLSPVKVRK